MADHHQFLHSLKQSFTLSDIDQSISNFQWPNPGHDQGLNSHDNFFPQLLECPGNIESIFPGLFILGDENNSVLSKPAAAQPVISNEKKPKGVEMSTTESSSCSPQVSDVGTGKANCSRRGKKVKGNIKEGGKPKEVVHVRAKRGQATDSHSLAERVRRGKINERFRCLQDIVPGCYKAMGMAGMLDQIINYVQSLQNQVEFLSMKLTAASEFYDFNSDTDAMETIQGAKGSEALIIQNVAIQGQPSAQFGPLDNIFGYYPQLPHNNRS